MNATQTIPSAAVAAVIIGAVATGDRFEAWGAALETYRTSRADQEAYYARKCRPANDSYNAAAADSPERKALLEAVYKTECGFGTRCSRTLEALGSLIRTPAPNLAAVAVKLDVMLAEEAQHNGPEDIGDYLTTLQSDLRRLRAS